MATKSTGLSKLQQPRSRATRSSLITSAAILWIEHGFDNTTVDDICEAAGLSKGAFYFHFARKEDLLLELAAETGSRVWSDWEDLEDTELTTTELARASIRSIAELSSSVPRDLLGRTVTEVFGAGDRWTGIRGDRRDFVAVFSTILGRGQTRGEISRTYNCDELGGLITLLVLAGALEWSQSSGDDLEDILWRRVELILKGAAKQ